MTVDKSSGGVVDTRETMGPQRTGTPLGSAHAHNPCPSLNLNWSTCSINRVDSVVNEGPLSAKRTSSVELRMENVVGARLIPVRNGQEWDKIRKISSFTISACKPRRA